MDRISQLVPRVLAKRGLKDQAGASYAVFLAKEWISEHAPPCTELCSVHSLSDSVLEIHADHPIILQELHQQAVALKEYLNGFEGISVTDIRIIRSKEPTN